MSFEDFCSIHQINITTHKLPNKVKGFVYYDSEEYHIIINDKLTHESSLKTLKHELMHIILGHFESERPIEELEIEIQNKINHFEFCFG